MMEDRPDERKITTTTPFEDEDQWPTKQTVSLLLDFVYVFHITNASEVSSAHMWNFDRPSDTIMSETAVQQQQKNDTVIWCVCVWVFTLS